MLRTIVLLLLLANIGYFSWTRDWLTWAGLHRPVVATARPAEAAPPIAPEKIRLTRIEPAADAAVDAGAQTDTATAATPAP